MTGCWKTAFCRVMRTGYFPVLAVLLAVMLFLLPMIGSRGEAPAAFFVPGHDEVSVRIAGKLTELGYTAAGSEEELKKGVSGGRYDCGVILDPDPAGLISRGETEKLGTFVVSPLSARPDLSRDAAAAVLYAEVAPYLSAGLLEGSGITADEVTERYRERMEEGYRFVFDLVTVDGKEAETAGGPDFTGGAAALFLFAALMFSSARMLSDDAAALTERIGKRAVWFRVLLPEMTVRAGLLILAAAFSRGLPFAGIAVYILLLTFFGASAALILGRTLPLFSFFVVLASLAVCPVYTDLTLVLPWLRTVRCVFPTYWLWLASDHPAVMAAAAAVFFAVSTALFLLAGCRKRPAEVR